MLRTPAPLSRALDFMKILSFIRSPDSKVSRALDLGVLLLILYSIVTFSVETLPDLPVEVQSFLETSEVIVTGLFTLEYGIRLAAAERSLRYVFSFYGLVDFLSIAPFYLMSGIDMRAIRVVRLFRIFRILKLARYSKAIRRFGKAIAIAKEEIILFMLAALILIYLAAVGIYYFEHDAQPDKFQSIFHSLWWAVATLTTVGYGDVFPITTGGKLFTFVVLAVGLGIVAVPTGLIASALTRVREKEDEI